jgi:hypothetical protein
MEFMAGEHISNAAKKMIQAANRSGSKVVGKFNDVELIAHPGWPTSQIESYYDSEIKRRHEIYRASPQGISHELAHVTRIKKAQVTADALMSYLDRLDFNDLDAVLGWLGTLQDPSDTFDVNIDKARIVKTFHEHGYESNCNPGPEFKDTSRDNYARYIIGQCLAMLENPPYAIHHMAVTFIDRWRFKFPEKS